jgi:predicted outer membrane protein
MTNLKFLIILAIGMLLLSASCGPTAEQKEAAEQHRSDSIAAAQAQLEAAKEAARQQAIEDSIAEADSTVIMME